MADDDDTLDAQTLAAMKVLDGETPTGYFDHLPNRILEATMHTEPHSSESHPKMTAPPSSDDSGLHDIRSLAQNTKRRLSAKIPAQSASDDILASSSGSFRNIALPEPAKMISLPELAALPSKAEIKAKDKAAQAAKKAERTAPTAPTVATEAAETAARTEKAEPAVAAAAVAAAPAAAGTPAVATPAAARTATPIVAPRTAAPKQKQNQNTRTIALVGMGVAVAAGVAVVFATRGGKPHDAAAPVVVAQAEAPPAKVVTAQPIAPPPVVAPIAAPDPTPPPTPAPDVAAVATPPASAPIASAGQSRGAKHGAGGGSAAATNAARPAHGDALATGAAGGAAAAAGEAKGSGAHAPGDPSFDDLLKEAGVSDQHKTVAPKLDKKSLAASDIISQMGSLSDKAKSCFKGTQGTAAVKLIVAPSGKVTKVSVGGVFAGTPEGECVAGVARTASFPPWDGGPQTVNYSYLLSE